MIRLSRPPAGSRVVHAPHRDRRPRALLLLPALWLGAALLPGPVRAQQTGTVRGTVINSLDSLRFQGVQVSLPGARLTALTDANGAFRFRIVPTGPDTLQASLPGYGTRRVPVTVNDGQVTVAVIDVQPEWAGWLPPPRPDTRLDSLRTVFRDSLGLLPPRDWEDRSPLPSWFRAYLRHSLPFLPQRGPLQYPLVSAELFEWMLLHEPPRPPASGVLVPAGIGVPARHLASTRDTAPAPFLTTPGQSTVVGGTNANLSNQDLEHRETSVAIQPGAERYVLAAANNSQGSPPSLAVFRSSDSGCSWVSDRLPLNPEDSWQADPSVAWAPEGTGWVAAVAEDTVGADRLLKIRLYRTEDRGATWTFAATVSEGGSNDKEMIATPPAGDVHQGRVYVAWTRLSDPHQGGGIRFRWVERDGASMGKILPLSTAPSVGAHVAVGSGGTVYVAWYEWNPDPPAQPSLVLRASRDGGDTFGPPVTIASVRARGYQISLPAMDQQRALIYPVLATAGPREPVVGTPGTSGPSERVFVVWTDLSCGASDPDSVEDPVHTNVYFRASSAQALLGDNATWTGPIQELPPEGPWSDHIQSVPGAQATVYPTDEFNPWMAVDPGREEIHVAYYSTMPRHRLRTQLLHAFSTDGGASFKRGTAPVTNAWTQDDSVTGMSQYGDYSGLAALKGIVLPVWTDHRENLPWDRHQIFSAMVREGSPRPLECPAVTLEFHRSSLTLEPGKTAPVTARILRSGQPATGEWVSLEMGADQVASADRTSVQARDGGRLHFSITGHREGSTRLLAGGAGTVAILPVHVSGPGWPWWLWVLLGAAALGLFLVLLRVG